jgi:catechol 2,3-dioxygenase-like lactoylglutathione lyase family enzyme
MYLEHANLTVPSIEHSMKFLNIAFPDFRQRGGGAMFGDETLGQWVHFGNDETYLALNQVTTKVPEVDSGYASAGLNHLGFVVDDIYAIIERYRAAGYEPSDANSMGAHPHRERVYFKDECGVEWEFVQYLSEQAPERNDYAL